MTNATTFRDGRVPIAVVQYELTDDLASRVAMDLLDCRIQQSSGQYPVSFGARPVAILVLAAVQILVAIIALLLFDGWNWIVAKVLIAAGVVVIGILLWKATFYSLPALGRRLVAWKAVRAARSLTCRRIRWLLYEEHLETESASSQRRIGWPEVAKMTHCGQSVVLSLKSGVELVIPESVLSAEAQSILERRIAPTES
jgi:hypothetical protein